MIERDTNVTELDLERITHPLRLAQGSHKAESGMGCAMNLVSWIQGDRTITDFPSCVARTLAKVVQGLNDACATEDFDYGDGRRGKYIPVRWTMRVLEQAFAVMGTAETARLVNRVEWRRRVNRRTGWLGVWVTPDGYLTVIPPCWSKTRVWLATKIAVAQWMRLVPELEIPAPTPEQVETAAAKMTAVRSR